MSHLSHVSDVTRKAIIGAAIGLVALVIGYALYQQLLEVIANNRRPTPPTPTLGFGPLPAPQFSGTQDYTFTLETIGNQLPSWGTVAPVFPKSFPRPSLLDTDNTKRRATSLGFLFDPVPLSPTVSRFTNSQPLPARLDINTVNAHFDLSVAWETDPNFLRNNLTPSQDQAILETKQAFSRAGLLPEDLEKGQTSVTFLRYANGALEETIAYEAKFLRVNLFRASLQAPPRLPLTNQPQEREQAIVVTPNLDQGLAQMTISSSRNNGERIVSANYRYSQVAYQQYQTYPIITGPEAWQLLTSGQGHVAKNSSNTKTPVIRSVQFGYYDDLGTYGYLLPIYIFSGDGGFVAYVNAVKPTP